MDSVNKMCLLLFCGFDQLLDLFAAVFSSPDFVRAYKWQLSFLLFALGSLAVLGCDGFDLFCGAYFKTVFGKFFFVCISNHILWLKLQVATSKPTPCFIDG